MQSFIYDKYGYDIKIIDNDTFMYENWVFKIINIGELETVKVIEYINFIKGLASRLNINCDVIKTRNGDIFANSDEGNIILFAIEDYNYSLSHILFIHNMFTNLVDSTYSLDYIISLWEDKINLIEEKNIPNIQMDDYFYNYVMKSSIYIIGLAENAIQYVKNIMLDYRINTLPLTISHRRLKSFSFLELLNPFNIVIDFKGRDYVELFKNNLITIDELFQCIDKEHMTIMEVSMIFARIIFPSNYFDLFEQSYLTHQDIRNKIIDFYNNIEEYQNELYLIHNKFVNKYKIRTINWLK